MSKKIKEFEDTKSLTLEELVNDKVEEKINESDPSDLVSLIAISELTNKKNLKMISRVKSEQIPTISKLDLYADTFEVPFMRNLANNILELQVSYNGLGRKELVSVVNQSTGNQLEQKGLFKQKEIFR
ncbi:MAG: hypothetical protein QXN68_02670 [Thermoplasmata archaeon]